MHHQIMLENNTDFTAQHFVLCNKDGQEVLLVIVVATFETNDTQTALRLAKEQCPVRPVDEHYGNPANTGIRYESNIVLEKPFVDTLINGYAYAPKGSEARSVKVSVSIGDVHKSLLVQGNRTWSSGSTGSYPSRAEKFHKMPIVYERAFGGIDSRKGSADLRNPIGLGYRGAPSNDAELQTQIPNIEYLDDQITSPSDIPNPAGFGALSRNFQQRIKFAGTYDDKWLDEQWPLLPLDFNSRFNQTAPEDQQSNTLVGGEIVKLFNLTKSGYWEFKLPILDVPVNLCYDGQVHNAELRMDTILIEPDIGKVSMTSRLTLELPRTRLALREVVLGHMCPGWAKAKSLGKNYIDNMETKGVNPVKQNFYL